MSDPVPSGRITSREQVDAYLNHLTLFGIKLGLETVQTLLNRLDRPHHRYPSIHVAGSNGKGSVCAVLDALLSGYGNTVGRYTSPHLVDFSERITVAGAPVGDAELVRLADRLSHAAQGLPQSPTFFEVGTVMALDHFATAKQGKPVDVAVVETGMGGRLDATNVLSPQVTVITNVSLEHTAYLGATLEQVAAEKAGIIKPGIPVVTGADGLALAVIRQQAERNNAPLYVLGEDFDITPGRRFSYQGIRTNYAGLTLNLPGAHQRRNAALALAALELFFPPGVAVAEAVVSRTLATVSWPGRLERVADDPPVLLDCAHNGDGARVLADYLHSKPFPGPLFLVLGVLADKDFSDILRPLAPYAEQVLLCAPVCDRAADLPAQVDEAGKLHGNVQAVPDVSTAVATARAEASRRGGWVLVAGSVYTIGEARAALCG